MTHPDIGSSQASVVDQPTTETPIHPPSPSQSPTLNAKTERRHSVLGHTARRSFGGSDGLNLLRLPSHHNQSSKDASASVNSQPEAYTFNNIDDFDIKSPIGESWYHA